MLSLVEACRPFFNSKSSLTPLDSMIVSVFDDVTVISHCEISKARQCDDSI
jgi:hypothetical protein